MEESLSLNGESYAKLKQMKNKLDSVIQTKNWRTCEAEKKRHRQAQDALHEKSAEVKSLQSKVRFLSPKWTVY